MGSYIVTLGVQFLTGFSGADRWSTNRKLAFPFRDREAADRQADRINGLKLGNQKAKVKAGR